METESLTLAERRQLLKLARQAIEMAVQGLEWPPLDLNRLPPRLCEKGASFVTLTMPNGDLRGCIGGLEAVKPLAVDVCEHAAAAALEDYRFNPVRLEEVPLLTIEISRLTSPRALEYDQPEDLPNLLHPGVDGVILRYSYHRATFLPQVWEKLPDPRAFLTHLCDKMGVPGDFWRKRKLSVEIYHVEEFQDETGEFRDR